MVLKKFKYLISKFTKNNKFKLMKFLYNKQFIIFNFIQKSLISGKKKKTGNLILNFLILLKKKKKNYLNILKQVFLKLMIFFSLKVKKINVLSYQIPKPINYKKALLKSISWLIKAVKNKAKNKLAFHYKLYLECDNVLKNQGTAYQFKYNFSKKALFNRVITYLTIKNVKKI